MATPTHLLQLKHVLIRNNEYFLTNIDVHFNWIMVSNNAFKRHHKTLSALVFHTNKFLCCEYLYTQRAQSWQETSVGRRIMIKSEYTLNGQDNI